MADAKSIDKLSVKELQHELTSKGLSATVSRAAIAVDLLAPVH